MAVSLPASGGHLNVELSAAAAEIYRKQHWQTPGKTTAVHHENVVVIVMQDVLNLAERIMVHDGAAAQVQRLRRALREVSESQMRAAVGRFTGRAVTAALTVDQLDAAMEAHVFLLD